MAPFPHLERVLVRQRRVLLADEVLLWTLLSAGFLAAVLV